MAHPDISPIDVAYIAQRYVGREIAAVVMGEEPEMSDLDAWLAYRGWSEWESLGSSNRHDIYLKAVKEGKIPPLKSTYDAQRQAAEVYPKSGFMIDLSYTMEAIGRDPEHPELLPRRQRGTLMEREDRSPGGKS